MFGRSDEDSAKVSRIHVINLDRQTPRWRRMQAELSRLHGSDGETLLSRTSRFSAVDGKTAVEIHPSVVEPVYSFSDQMYVDPEPLLANGPSLEDRRIRMSRPELAVAKSHFDVWQMIASSEDDFALVLEDDVYFVGDAPDAIDMAWRELLALDEPVDMLFLSHREAASGALKKEVSPNLFRPVRGLWQMSGYVLSREGARKLLAAAPIRGPVDLWINFRFPELNVFATATSLIEQRPDGGSDNLYSILPVLSTAGVLNKEAPNLFVPRLPRRTVIAWTDPGQAADRLAMALSMLGFRCHGESEMMHAVDRRDLLAGGRRYFDAYVNPPFSPADLAHLVRKRNGARFIITGETSRSAFGATLAMLPVDQVLAGDDEVADWASLCGFLGAPKPDSSFPKHLGQEPGLFAASPIFWRREPSARQMPADRMPWIAKRRSMAVGQTSLVPIKPKRAFRLHLQENFSKLDTGLWHPLADTFPGNKAMFDPQNVSLVETGLALTLRKSPAVVRDYTAGSIRSTQDFHYGRFEATLKPARGSGLITGFFLHRYFPRQEIDIELLGKDTTKLLLNVYYNPGDDQAAFNYGHRGTPVSIDLGFDASLEFHRYAMEWLPDRIRWFVDDRLVHERGIWDPTPVPHLPMEVFVNLWSAYSHGFAGRLDLSALPASTIVHSVRIDTVEDLLDASRRGDSSLMDQV